MYIIACCHSIAMSEICSLIWRKSERSKSTNWESIHMYRERQQKTARCSLGLSDMLWVLLLILVVFEHSGQQWKIALAGG